MSREVSERVLQFEHGECTHKIAVQDAIRTAINDILALHKEELRVVPGGNFEGNAEIEGRLAQAREHKALLIERLREHVASHGC